MMQNVGNVTNDFELGYKIINCIVNAIILTSLLQNQNILVQLETWLILNIFHLSVCPNKARHITKHRLSYSKSRPTCLVCLTRCCGYIASG